MIETLKKQKRGKIGGGCEGQPPSGTMKILCLNCQGLGQFEVVRDLRSLIELHCPHLGVLIRNKVLLR